MNDDFIHFIDFQRTTPQSTNSDCSRNLCINCGDRPVMTFFMSLIYILDVLSEKVQQKNNSGGEAIFVFSKTYQSKMWEAWC